MLTVHNVNYIGKIMENVNEKILDAWINLIMAVNSERLVLKMPFNEAIICNILDHNQDKIMTATDLCHITKMQKSQMNRTLTSLEKKGMIERQRREDNKREIQITLLDNGSETYQDVHNQNLAIVDKIIKRIGIEHADEIYNMFSLITSVAKEEIK